jgi:uracil-DNA glycosylase
LHGQLFKQLHPDWISVLSDLRPHIDLIEKSVDRLEIAPDFNNIFRALNTPISSVHVVIFGQDPYPAAGFAHGLAFSSVAENGSTPASLRSIFHELADDLGKPLRTQTDLSDWSEQGVLLLNRILTTNIGSTLAHTDLQWEKVTDQIAKELGKRDVVAVCWGKSAQQVSKFFRREWLVSAPHPSPLSAYRGFFGSQPFSKVNEILEKNKLKPITW